MLVALAYPVSAQNAAALRRRVLVFILTPFVIARGLSWGADGSLTGGREGKSPNGGFVIASDGRLYISTSRGGANNVGTIAQVSLGGTAIAVHDFELFNFSGPSPAGNSLIQAQNGALYGAYGSPTALIIDSYGVVYRLNVGAPPR